MTGKRDEKRQACDGCRFRKVRCDRRQPCQNCRASDLPCLYLHNIRRKGPKAGHGQRQSQLRPVPADASRGVFRIMTMTQDAVPPRFRATNRSHSRSPEPRPLVPIQVATTTQHDDAFNAEFPSFDQLQAEGAGQIRSLSISLIAHIQLFLKVMFPIMPVVDSDELLADAARLEELSPSRYALVVALCAATRIQIGMDNAPASGGRRLEEDMPSEPQLTGEMLIHLAETSLRQYDVIDDTSLDSVLASFFLFASYGNLDNSRHAWFYLNQSISLAQSLDINRETGYHHLPEIEQEKRRRIFWLLFVTERTFALQHRRSVILRNSITKPQVIDSDCPVVMNDFVNHIRLFETLPGSLYEWQSLNDSSNQPKHLSLVLTVQDKLRNIQPDESLIPSQRFDTLITQQWLRVSLWRLAAGENMTSAAAYNFAGLLLPPGLPIDAGKLVVSALGSVRPKSKDCHGIGMEQKLFNIGVSLADCAMLPSLNCSSFEAGPRDLLCAVIAALSNARGCESHLLPPLLKHSESVLGLMDPTRHIGCRLQLTQETEDTIRDAVVADTSAQVEEELVDILSWPSGDEFSMLNMSTPSSTWDSVALWTNQV